MNAEDNEELVEDLKRKAMAKRQLLFDAGALITEQQLCKALAISRQALEQSMDDDLVFYISGPNDERWYPSFFADESVLRDVEAVSFELGNLASEVKFQFFMTPKHSLNGRTPIAAISNWYEVESVLRCAAAFKERSLGC